MCLNADFAICPTLRLKDLHWKNAGRVLGAVSNDAACFTYGGGGMVTLECLAEHGLCVFDDSCDLVLLMLNMPM